MPKLMLGCICVNWWHAAQMEIRSAAGDARGHTLFKPAHLRHTAALGLKVVSVRAGNAALGLPAVPGVIIVLNEATGLVRGIVDGTYVTALRTGAGSGAATDAMAGKAASRLCVRVPAWF
jgi:ornithine cyclodeaminase/alanine dehydrogenase-like protein (mu-crystallin family)